MSEQHQITILHVDDNEANRYVVSRMLRNAGFEVKEAATGASGLQAAEQQPDLIILDVQLPDINGFEVCRRIKANSSTSSIPVLHLSASFINSKDKVQGLDGGADGYLAQPVEPIELIATIKALLRIRRAEESALAKAREWQTTFDAMSDGICLLDTEGKILRWNSAMGQVLTGDSRLISAADENETNLNSTSIEAETSIFQKLFSRFINVQDPSEVNPFTRARKTRQRESIEICYDTLWFRVTVDPMLDDRTAFRGAVCIAEDITDRRYAKEALRASEERFRMLLENLKDYAIFFFDTQGRIISWGIGAQSILGYQEAEILGKSVSCIFTPEDLEGGADKQELETAATEGRAEDERWHLRKDGTRFWASGIVTPLRDETGQLRGFAKILRDFTERKQAEDERIQLLTREQEARASAEAANRMKDEFLATLSHELRSPLNAMLGWIQLLNTRKFDEVTTARAMKTIERSAKTQAQLVEDLLDVSRIIQGKLRLNVRPLELVTVIEAAIDTIRPAADAKAINLISRLDPAAGLVSGDSDRLQQVIWNLLTNAIKFTSKEGRVEVRLERVNSSVEVTVSDTGEGIDPEFVPYVFDRFRQADSSMTRSYSGLGLGLAIVRHLVELQGGTVHAQSEGAGQGSTFVVKLPLMAISLQADNSQQLPAIAGRVTPFYKPTALDNIHVLVVDDDADSRLFLATALQGYGAKVTAAASAAEAMKEIAQLKPDILVSDIGMPEEDGYSLIRKIRALSIEQGGQIPAAAITAYARTEDRTRSLLEGFQIHMSKPVDPLELAAAIANLAGRTNLVTFPPGENS